MNTTLQIDHSQPSAEALAVMLAKTVRLVCDLGHDVNSSEVAATLRRAVKLYQENVPMASYAESVNAIAAALPEISGGRFSPDAQDVAYWIR